MLSQGVVDGILVPQEIPSRKTVVQTLVSDPAKLEGVNPFAPVFGVNSARVVAKMCVGLTSASASQASPAAAQSATAAEQAKAGAADAPAPEGGATQTTAENRPSVESPEGATATEQPRTPLIGVVLRPCESRALVELAKLQQVSLDPFLIIGVDCWGTYSIQDYAEKAGKNANGSSVTAEFLQQAQAGKVPAELRNACRVCQYPTPACADVAVHLFGEDITRQVSVHALSEKGKDVFGALGLQATQESSGRENAVTSLRAARKQTAADDNLNFLETIATLCINCRNCRAVCPICYCRQCVFDGRVFEYTMDKYLNWSGKKGMLRMPPDKLLFHLTRMSHVSASCVACGQCEAACPSGIPLGRFYQRVSSAVQEALGYQAGRSIDDELPLTTFRDDELSAVED